MEKESREDVKNCNSMTSIIIVTYKSQETITRLLKSLQNFLIKGTYEIIVVDNNSADKTLVKISDFSNIKAISLDKNRGFAYACHAGVARSKGNNLLFINPDVYIQDEVLSKLISLISDRTIGVIGTKILNIDGSVQCSVRRFPTLFSQLLIVLKLNHITTSFTSLKKYFATDFNYEKESDVDQVMGAMFLTKKSVWDDIGGFDKRFFIWFEEVDYCFQVKKNGLRVVYTPYSSVVHAGGESFSKVSFLKKQYWYVRSMLQYFIKNGV